MRILFFVLVLSFVSCDSSSLPKQKGFFAPDFSYPKYTIQNLCNFSYNINLDSNIININDCNHEIKYNKLKAKVYLNKINLNNNLNEISSIFDEKVFNNSEYADRILTSEYSNYEKKVYSKLYFFVGDAPSNIQFYLTDSLSNFLSASVYFDSKPNYDSLFPYIHYIRSDIKKIIESFEWINE